jgi:NitT/TauT family transport system substrate-binding protein
MTSSIAAHPPGFVRALRLMERAIMRSARSIALALAMIAQAITASASAADKVKVSLAATDDAVYLPYFIAIDKGYYQALDLDVEVVHLGGGMATPALLSGSLDFSTSTGSAMSAVLNGAGLNVVMTLSESVPWKLWSTEPEVKTLADLKDKRVGVQTRGDLFELSMRAVLLKAGLPADSVVYVPLGFGRMQRMAIAKSGTISGIMLTNFEENIARDSGVLRSAHMLVDLGKEIRIPNNGVATSQKFLLAHPTIVERFVRGTLMGMRYLKTQREGTLRIFAKRVPTVPPDVLRASIDETAAVLLDDGMTSRAIQQAELALRSAMLGQSPQRAPSPEQVFDYAMVRRAAETLKASNWTPAE